MKGTCVARVSGMVATVVILVAAAPAFAGSALVDLLDVETLEQTEPGAGIACDGMLDLLVLEVVRERIATGALAWTTAVPVHVVADDAGPALAAHARLTVGELLQLALLTRSRGAVASLAAAAGPGWERARARMRRTAARLELTGTVVPDGWPAGGAERDGPKSPSQIPAAPGYTTVRDLARVAAVVAGDAEVRRRLALDGTPIADGALIVRATYPLIAVAAPGATATRPRTPRGASAAPDAALALVARDGLELLAVATGVEAETAVWQVLERGLARYRRIELVRAGQPIAGERDGHDGVRRDATAVAARAFALTVPRAGSFDVSAWVQLPARTADPVEANSPMGELVFARAGRIIGAVQLVAPPSIAPNRWLDTARR